MDKVSLALQLRLQATSRLLLTHALEHALNEAADETDILQTIVNMQAAMELYSKLYLLRRNGWRSIVDSKLHSRAEPDLLADIEAGNIRTVQFWKSRDLVSESIYLDEDDRRLLDEFQGLRNQLMHLGLVQPSKDILNQAIWLLVRVFHQLEWTEALSHRDKYFSNSLKAFLGARLFERLVTRSSYVAEAVDRAYDAQLGDSVRYCLECGNEAMVENDEELLCFVCAFRAPSYAIGFIDCGGCGTEDCVAYDKLNVGRADQTGKCCHCRRLVEVSRCKECTSDFAIRSGCAYCSQ